MEKVCKKCSIAKLTTEFTQRLNVCKACKKLYLAQYRLDHKEQCAANEAAWYKAHKTHVIARVKKNKHKYAAKEKLWKVGYRKTHLKEHAQHEATRRARKNASPVIEKIDRDIIYKRDKGICQLCHTKVKRQEMSTDHVIPLAEGGEHSYRNIVLTHTLCNIRKGKRRVTQQIRLIG